MDSKVMISGEGGAPPPDRMSIRRMLIPAVFSVGIYFSSLRIDGLAEHPLFVPLIFFLWAEVALTLGLVSCAVAGARVRCEDQLAAVKRAEEIAMRIANMLLFFVFVWWIAIGVSIRFSAV